MIESKNRETRRPLTLPPEHEGGHTKMELLKETKSFGIPAESRYGYVQGVKVGQMIYISGQLSHDEKGNMVGAAPLDGSGRIADSSNMKVQMEQAYVNVKKV